MKPLSEWPSSQRRGMRGVLTDIDDTLTTHGRLTPDVLAALGKVREAGLMLIAVTGRPTYWAQPLLRLCGFDAVIAENGASAFWLDADDVQQSWFYADATTRRAHRIALDTFAVTVCQHFPGIAVADDAAQRIGDLAFDIGENIPRRTDAEVDALTTLMRDYGFFAVSSSIHAHASLVAFSKQRTTTRILREGFGISDASACDSFVFIGDSGNDATMFSHYPHAIGVANVAAFLHLLPKPPTYVASAERGAGFVQIINALLEARES